MKKLGILNSQFYFFTDKDDRWFYTSDQYCHEPIFVDNADVCDILDEYIRCDGSNIDLDRKDEDDVKIIRKWLNNTKTIPVWHFEDEKWVDYDLDEMNEYFPMCQKNFDWTKVEKVHASIPPIGNAWIEIFFKDETSYTYDSVFGTYVPNAEIKRD